MYSTFQSVPPTSRPKRPPAVGPRLKVVLFILFATLSVMGANSCYLLSVSILNWITKQSYENWFYHWMFLLHLVIGLILLIPFTVFISGHLAATYNRLNKRAIKAGYGLLSFCLLLLISGLLLMRVGNFDLHNPLIRQVLYWMHVLSPVGCLWLYWLHRLAGPRIRWKYGLVYLMSVIFLVGSLLMVHHHDPRLWYQQGPQDSEKYFAPSLARTANGRFISAKVLDHDEYCLQCHRDAYEGWYHSAHHFSSFNNPAYLASVRETRQVVLERDGTVHASRWCAGCHDPVPFFSGAFDDPQFDDVRHPTAHAGITCTTCHAITHINSTRGNADYTIEEPQHYPFAFSTNPALQWINHQLVKAKPAFHKKTFLKEFHKTAEFCSVCHKVHIPYELNHYKDFLRGQNHYDTYLLSGVSGHGARSFYYPEHASPNCATCHMPLQPSNDFGARLYPNLERPSIHNHLFPAANTGLAWLRGADNIVKIHQEYLQDKLRVDIFGLRDGSQTDSPLIAPLRPQLPTLERGKNYILEVVVRTLKIGHPFTQGTADSNEVWLDVTLRSGAKIIGRSGAIDELGHVDPWAHFINIFMLDKEGRRIDRRNPQDIFIPLYNNQIPPGAAQTVHYGFTVPEDVSEPIEISVKVNYRKFDQTYMEYIARSHKPGDPPLRGYNHNQHYRNPLPITVMATDHVILPLAGGVHALGEQTSNIPEWQRWNDYGIGLLLKGKAELRQAAHAFEQVEQMGRYDGPLNLARVYFAEGRLNEATAAIQRAAQHTNPTAPPWTLAWLSGLVNREQGHLAEAEAAFRSILSPPSEEVAKRGFDFRKDYEIINLLGMTLFDQAKQIRGSEHDEQRIGLLQAAAEQFEETLKLDPENVTAHYNLSLIYQLLNDEHKAELHRRLHHRYKFDDNAADRAIALARQRYPAANHAAEKVVIYPLQRRDAPGLSLSSYHNED